MTYKKMAFFAFFSFAALVSFAGELPFVIRNYYSDWNLVALAATSEEQDIYWKMIGGKKAVDIRGLSQRGAMIIGALVNVYNNYPSRTGTCPIKDTVLYVTDISQDGSSYLVTFELHDFRQSKKENGRADLNRLFERMESIPKLGSSRSVWEYVDNEYRLKKDGVGAFLIQ